MAYKHSKLAKFLTLSSYMAGKPISFLLAISFIAFWIIYGMIYGFTSYWLLIINTIATINAALMVFIIQNTQNRHDKALHLKIDEIIRAIAEAENELMFIEEMEESELDELRNKILEKRKKQIQEKKKS